MVAGLISWEEFQTNAQNFLQLSRINNNDWTWEILKDEPGFKYLCKKVSRIFDNIPELIKNEREVPKDLEDQVLEDGEKQTLVTSGPPPILITFEYHVIYSLSYSVPILFFNAWKQNGRLLSLSEIWSLVPGHFQERLQAERWTFLTQQEHPLFGKPFFQLHPCYTSNMMKIFTDKKQCKNYLVTWLSSVGPVVQLQIPLFYACIEENTNEALVDSLNKEPIKVPIT